MQSATKRVPENLELAAMAAFYHGLNLLKAEKSKEAAAALRVCRDRWPESALVNWYLLAAEAGEAFDAKDYDGFLSKERAMWQLSPDNPVALMGLASGYACQYAVSGSNEMKQAAMKFLNDAMATTKVPDPQFGSWKARILHRLETREIIRREEYDRRFPNGWRAKE